MYGETVDLVLFYATSITLSLALAYVCTLQYAVEYGYMLCGVSYLITANSPIQRACPPLTLLSRGRFLYTCGDIRTPARFRLLCLILPFSVIQQAVCTEHGVRSTYPYPCATTDTESVLNRIPDGVRCKANNQPIQCKFLVVNYASSAILEDSKRIDSLTLFICYLLLVSRNEAFRGIPNARATKPRPWKKSKSMSTSFLPSLHQRNHYRRAFCNRKSMRFRATMLPLLFLNTELLLVDTAYTSPLSVRIAPPICCPALLANQRGSPVRPQSNSRGYVASPFTQ